MDIQVEAFRSSSAIHGGLCGLHAGSLVRDFNRILAVVWCGVGPVDGEPDDRTIQANKKITLGSPLAGLGLSDPFAVDDLSVFGAYTELVVSTGLSRLAARQCTGDTGGDPGRDTSVTPLGWPVHGELAVVCCNRTGLGRARCIRVDDGASECSGNSTLGSH